MYHNPTHKLFKDKTIVKINYDDHNMEEAESMVLIEEEEILLKKVFLLLGTLTIA